MLPMIDMGVFRNNKNVTELINSLIESVQKEDAHALYKAAFRNVDLRFKDIKEHNIENFIGKLVRDLKVMKNRIT